MQKRESVDAARERVIDLGDRRVFAGDGSCDDPFEFSLIQGGNDSGRATLRPNGRERPRLELDTAACFALRTTAAGADAWGS
jgi:hypothetical protein